MLRDTSLRLSVKEDKQVSDEEGMEYSEENQRLGKTPGHLLVYNY